MIIDSFTKALLLMQSYKQPGSLEYFTQDLIQIVRMHYRGALGENFVIKQINYIDFLNRLHQ